MATTLTTAPRITTVAAHPARTTAPDASTQREHPASLRSRA